MDEANTNIWIGINQNDFKEFERAVKRVEETNIFPMIMHIEKFTKLNENTYSKGDDQLIKVFHEKGKWHYQNLKKSKDSGSAIQFIANRWFTQTPRLEKSPSIIFQSAKVANVYYQSHIKNLKNKYRFNLLLNPPVQKKKKLKR